MFESEFLEINSTSNPGLSTSLAFSPITLAGLSLDKDKRSKYLAT